jgi:anti-sigma regulatory factor (Ser/Thr protein kinase)
MENQRIDRIEITLPARREYAKLLRLAAAAVASRMNFDVDRMEDIKIGLEEAYLIAVYDKMPEFKVFFDLYPDRLELVVPNLAFHEALNYKSYRRYGFSILHSVMDTVEWTKHRDSIKHLKMVKYIQR